LAALLGDFAVSDKAVFHESRMIYQPDGEFPGFGWIEELLQAQPQEKDVGPRLLDPAQCALDRKDAAAA
jgi:hypothetical protein